jgi:hypothetical protein
MPLQSFTQNNITNILGSYFNYNTSSLNFYENFILYPYKSIIYITNCVRGCNENPFLRHEKKIVMKNPTQQGNTKKKVMMMLKNRYEVSWVLPTLLQRQI